MTPILKRILTSTLVAGMAIPMFGVPARPGSFTVTQPDGTSVSMTIHGDEHFHYLKDSEGYLVRQQADGWYRILDSNGQPTSLAAMDKSLRSSSDATLLSGIDPQQTFNSLYNKAVAARPFAAKAPAMQRVGSVPPAKWDNADGHDLRVIPTDGERHVLVILVNFSNLQWSFADDPNAEMHDMLNLPGYDRNYCNGSVADYFHASSNDIYQPIFDVYGPVNLDKPYGYYGRNDNNGNDSAPYEMIADACRALDDEIDFSIYDTNGDGYVDNVYVFYAGYGENEGVGSNYIWPHSFNLRYVMDCPKLDGVLIDRYACSNELTVRSIEGNKKTHSGIGTFCHEFSHVLGLPDLYATTYTGAFTPGEYSLMDHGSYNNDSRTPPIYSIYEKYALEWEKPIDITEGARINTQPTVDGGLSYRMTIDPSRPTEYFLFENRQTHSWDSYIPGHGLLVWHIDYDPKIWEGNIVNNNPAKQYVDIVEADDSDDDGTRAGDTFPGMGNISRFSTDAAASPRFANWSGKPSSMDISHIYENETGSVSFTVGDGGTEDSELYVAAPSLRLTGVSDTSLSFSWDKVPGASRYFINALSMMADDFYGTLETEMVPEYRFADLGDKTQVTLTGLNPGYSYLISLYSANDINMSDSNSGFFSTFASDLADITPQLSVTPGDTWAQLQWFEVPDAAEYEATVATRVTSDNIMGQSVAWDNRKYPSDWSFPGGTFDTRADYVGVASPSLRLYDGTAITTGVYDQDIASIKFWLRASAANAPLNLKIYSVEPNYSLTQITEITQAEASKAGSQIEINDIPDGVRQLMLVYSAQAAGLTLNIDDIEIWHVGDIKDTPVNGYGATRVQGTALKAEGLTPLTEYVAYIKAATGSETSRVSKTVKFTTHEPSSISTTDRERYPFSLRNGIVTSTSPVDIYKADGTQIARRTIGAIQLPGRGIYIVTHDGNSTKIAW